MSQSFGPVKQKRHYDQQQIAKGTLLIVLGLGILLRKLPMTAPLMPEWLYGAHALLILLGLYHGVKHRFRNYTWLVLILVGVYLALRKYSLFSFSELHYIGLPVAVIIVGIYMILNRKR